MRKLLLGLLAASALMPAAAGAQDRPERGGRPERADRGEGRPDRGDGFRAEMRRERGGREPGAMMAPREELRVEPRRERAAAENPDRGPSWQGGEDRRGPGRRDGEARRGPGRQSRGDRQANGGNDPRPGWEHVPSRAERQAHREGFDRDDLRDRARANRRVWAREDRRADNSDGNAGWAGNESRRRNFDRGLSDWRDDARYRRDRDDRSDWNRSWRQDRRYDWNDYRARNRFAYRLPRYYPPSGWSGGYRRFSVGLSLGSGLFAPQYWIRDPWAYRLPPAYGPYRWVRYYDDALLVDLDSGRVVDVIHDIFW